jgi:asparagine synthase (glutamine-hydrolysing)
MCGILGWARPRGTSIDHSPFEQGLHRLRHRGPDDEGFLTWDSQSGTVLSYGGRDTHPSLDLPRLPARPDGSHVILGHRRLAIIDLSPRGHQPMRSADKRYWLTFNGEIYNYVELRRELEAGGVRFYTNSDTEVLLEAYAIWGAAAFARFVGMFALAILDTKGNELVLARDVFGIKPLYYGLNARGFVFGSEIKALLRLPGIARMVRADHIYQYLRFGERENTRETLFADIEQVLPAELVRVNLDDLTVSRRKYWSPSLVERRDLSFNAAATQARDLFTESVKLHLRSDVLVGACLSGGLDSSAIVVTARALQTGGTPLQTFTFIADDPRMNEEKYARLVAGDALRTTRPAAIDLQHDFDRLFAAQELPFVGLSVYAQFRVFQLAHQHGVRVMLDGQGSDELFGGYPGHVSARVSGLIAQGRLIEAMRLLATVPNTLPTQRVRNAFSAVGRLLPARAQAMLLPIFDGPLYPSWLSKRWFQSRQVSPRIRPHGRGARALQEELALSTTDLTLPHLLRYEDYNSMHFSIESRVPFCTAALLDFAHTLPPDYLVTPSGETKAVLRHAMAPVLPGEIIAREKLGFPASDRRWLKHLKPWVLSVLGSGHARVAPFLLHDETLRMVDRELESMGHWSGCAWRVLCLLKWAAVHDVDWGEAA